MLILWHLLHGFCGAPAIHFSYKLKKNPFGLIAASYFLKFRYIYLTTFNIQNIFIHRVGVGKEIFCGKVFIILYRIVPSFTCLRKTRSIASLRCQFIIHLT